MQRPRTIFGICAMSLASAACVRQKTPPRAFTPPPVRSRPLNTTAPGALPDVPQFVVDARIANPPEVPEITLETLPGIPEAPRRVARRPVSPAPKLPSTGGTAPIEIAAAPRLAQKYTPEEFREHTKTLDETLERVNRELATVEGKNLTVEQKEIADRIRTFRKQAEQARDQDLQTAVSLARRADLLAKDLLERLP